MTVALEKLILHSGYPSIRQNNTVNTGSFSLSGSYAPGVNTQTFSFSLRVAPDLQDILINSSSIELGNSESTGASIIVSNAWVRRGLILVPASGALGTLPFVIAQELSGSTLTFRCYGVNQTAGSGTLTSTTVNYRLIDYSVF